MNNYEELLEEAEKNNITVYENYDLSERLKGLYCDGSVALDKRLDTLAEKRSVLSEEIGHHVTSTGNITDMSRTENRKQELKARLWAYNKLLPLSRIIEAFEHGCKNRFETAEFLNVTEDFLADTIYIYGTKYGQCVRWNEYMLIFNESNLTVMKPTQ